MSVRGVTSLNIHPHLLKSCQGCLARINVVCTLVFFLSSWDDAFLKLEACYVCCDGQMCWVHAVQAWWWNCGGCLPPTETTTNGRPDQTVDMMEVANTKIVEDQSQTCFFKIVQSLLLSKSSNCCLGLTMLLHHYYFKFRRIPACSCTNQDATYAAGVWRCGSQQPWWSRGSTRPQISGWKWPSEKNMFVPWYRPPRLLALQNLMRPVQFERLNWFIKVCLRESTKTKMACYLTVSDFLSTGKRGQCWLASDSSREAVALISEAMCLWCFLMTAAAYLTYLQSLWPTFTFCGLQAGSFEDYDWTSILGCIWAARLIRL